jgi:hypothetical protein
MQTTTTEFNAVATVALNDIDLLATLDQQAKKIATQIKTLKDNLANNLGEGKHRGDTYGVRITIEDREGSVDYKALCKAYGITDEQLAAFRGKGTAVIKVCPTA